MTVIHAASSSNPTGTQRRGLWLSYALCICVLSAVAGCSGTQQRGDRAFKSGHYSEALDHYEYAIEAGDDSAELYANAAQAAVRIGDFSLAERYFSRALRNGGGESVARELADFYIATSNYTKAVRVLQTVLETTDDPQTVFNDLGAALMYAGSPLNAESYLMVAQQMKPDDPVPYVNLGVLYDKYLQNRRLAYGFYKCFLELSPASRQSGKVRARVASLEGSFDRKLASRYDVACAKPYQPAKTESGTLKGEVARRLGEKKSEADAAAVPTPIEPPSDEGPETSGEADDDAGAITIDRGVVAPPAPASTSDNADKPSAGQVVALAENAFANHNHQEVVRLLKELPADALTTHLMGVYGQSLVSVGEFERARRWLTASIAESPAPAEVLALWTAYRALDRLSAAAALCERFEDSSGYGEFLRQCASAADIAGDATE